MSDLTIGPDTVVTLHVTMEADGHGLVQRTEPGAPLGYLHGRGTIVPGLEARLAGEAAGAHRSYVVPPAEGYGEPDPRLLKAAPLSALGVAAPRLGMRLATRDPDGELTPMTLIAIEDDVALLDLNPRLAGATLRFEVEVLDVRPATAAEREAGRALP